ncbi:MAG: hypothetical protein ACR2RF_02225, partial [Geminicoccaceae bacterium]
RENNAHKGESRTGPQYSSHILFVLFLTWMLESGIAQRVQMSTLRGYVIKRPCASGRKFGWEP